MKKQIFSTLVFAMCLILPFSVYSQEQRKKVGVVLSGGGAKGVAHIKALKVIEEAGIPIDYIVGTSMGSIVGGLYAIGYTPEQLDSMVRKQDWTFLLSDRIKRSAMSLTANALQNTLFRFLLQRTRKLPCPEELSKDRILPICSLI